MATLSTDHAVAGSGRTVVLLGPHGSGKSRLLAGVGARETSALRALSLQLAEDARVAYCSHKLLLHSHLTAERNLQLAATIAGVANWRERLRGLLPGAPWLTTAASFNPQRTAAILPRAELHLLALAVALLYDPQLLLIDDLGRGLSRPAQRDLWRHIVTAQGQAPRLILYATRDLLATRTMGDEVWLLDRGVVRRRWKAGALPQALTTVQAFGLTMKRQSDARRYVQRVQDLQPHDCTLHKDGFTVRVVAWGPQPTILELATAAGPGLMQFMALPVEVDLLPANWLTMSGEEDRPEDSNDITELMPIMNVASEAVQKIDVSGSWRLTTMIAWTTWLRFFQTPLGLVSLLAYHVILLVLLQAVAVRTQQGGSLLSRNVLIVLATAPGFLLGVREALYWARTTTMHTLFRKSRSPDIQHPLTLLSIFDLVGGRRIVLASGLGLGIFMILVAHTALFLGFWALMQWQQGSAILEVLATLMLWFLLAAVLIAIGVFAALPSHGNRKDSQ